jgi:hypothetical protein
VTERDMREALRAACGRLDAARGVRTGEGQARRALFPLMVGAGLALAACTTTETTPVYGAPYVGGAGGGGSHAGGTGGHAAQGGTGGTAGSGGEAGGAMPGYGVFGGYGGTGGNSGGADGGP